VLKTKKGSEISDTSMLGALPRRFRRLCEEDPHGTGFFKARNPLANLRSKLAW
jgi:hypothetical protein